jgi:hypothetical protein
MWRVGDGITWARSKVYVVEIIYKDLYKPGSIGVGITSDGHGYSTDWARPSTKTAKFASHKDMIPL